MIYRYLKIREFPPRPLTQCVLPIALEDASKNSPPKIFFYMEPCSICDPPPPQWVYMCNVFMCVHVHALTCGHCVIVMRNSEPRMAPDSPVPITHSHGTFLCLSWDCMYCCTCTLLLFTSPIGLELLHCASTYGLWAMAIGVCVRSCGS